MRSPDDKSGAPPHQGKPCVFEEVARIMDAEPSLGAVSMEPGRRVLSIASLGAPGDAAAEQAVERAVREHGEVCGILDLGGTCLECGALPQNRVGLGKVVERQPDGSVVLRRLSCPTAPKLYRWKRVRWPGFVTREVEALEPGAEEEAPEWKMLAALAGICLVFLVAGHVAARTGAPAWLVTALFALACVAGGWDAAVDTWEKLKENKLDVHFLMLAVAAGAAAVGAWAEGALLLFLFSAAGAMEDYAMGRTRREIAALFHGAPKVATVVGDAGEEQQVPVERLAPGMRVRVTGGDQVPVDFEVLSGESACDESNLTGESRPTDKRPGDTALAGTINLWGVLEGRVLRPASESALQKIIRLIRDAQKLKAPSQRFSDRFGTGYTYAILGLCLAMYFIWWLGLGYPPFVSGEGRRSAFYLAMTLLVVASPCALVISVPSGILSAIAFGARRGVLFRGGAAIETLAEASVVALDKTGTLTRGELELVGARVIEGDEASLRRVAWNLARLSGHPLSRAIKRLGSAWGVAAEEVGSLQSIPGKGLRGWVGGGEYVMGNRDFAGPGGAADGVGSEVWVRGPGLSGCFLFEDALRPEARGLLEKLHRRGMETVMLTGDRPEAAERIGREVGVGSVRAGLLPEDKVAAVEELKRGGRRVVMVGDGVNDAPVLAAADVGVAMGARGSDAALEQASVVLMNDRLENFLLAHGLSVRARRVIRQNLVLALGTVVVMVLATFTGKVPLAMGVAAHEGSTVVVVLNSLRLLFGRE